MPQKTAWSPGASTSGTAETTFRRAPPPIHTAPTLRGLRLEELLWVARLEAVLEEPAQILTRDAGQAPRLALLPDHRDAVVAVAVETHVALFLAQRPEPSHGSTVSPGPDGARTIGSTRELRRRGRPPALLGAPGRPRLLRRARRDAVPGRGDRRDRDLPARVERERERTLRAQPAHGSPGRALARDGRRLPRLLARGGRLRCEHDDAQLRALTDDRPGAALRRRDSRHAPRPRREHLPMARAGARPRPCRSLRRHPRGLHAGHGRPRGPAHRADARRRLPGRLERGRDADGREPDRRARALGRRARVGGRRPLRAARADRRRRLGRRRPRLLAVQVLRPAPRPRLRAARAARVVAALQGAARLERAARPPLRDGHAAARAAGRLRRRRLVRPLDRLGGHHRVGDRARRALPRRVARVVPAARASHDGRPRADVRLHRGRAGGARGGGQARGAGLCRLARQLLRARGDEAARPRGRRRRPRRSRPLQHGRGGRPAARRACAARIGGWGSARRDRRLYTIRSMAVYERHTLPNGLRVLTAPMPQAQSISCFVMLAAGSRYETRETNGIAHFAEHMFFKGTERRPTARDIAGEVDAIGGEFNAFTGKESTAYYVKCAAEYRDTALDVLVDMVRNSKFDSAEIEREKGVIVEEMNMYFDTPRDFISSVFDEVMYDDQPLGWVVIGRKETVRGATRETFMEYLERWYRPD